MSYKKYFFFVVFLSMVLMTSTITLSIFTPTGKNDHIIFEQSTAPNSNDIFLVNTTLKLLVNDTQLLANEVYSVAIGEDLNITVFFSDNNSIPLNGATINITRGGFTPLNEDIINNQYSVIINTTDLGIELLIISAWLTGYEPQSILLIVEVVEIATELILFVNQYQVNQGDIIQFEANELINITVFYKDYLTGAHLSGANVELLGINNMDELGSQFNITINSNDLNQGINILTVFAQLLNYQPKSIQFVIEDVERATRIQLFLNGIDKTADPVLELPIGAVINITIKFYDNLTGLAIPNALIQLIGESLFENLTENLILKQYSILLDSSNLMLGVKLFTIVAQAPTYQINTVDIRFNVNRITTRISGNTIIEIPAGETIHIEVELTDEDFGGRIIGAIVMYTWQFGQGELTDINSNGIYEVNLTSITVGTYFLEITAYKGVNYDFQSFQITIIISNPFSVFILSSSADIPDLDGNFYLFWISSGHANNYSIYVSNSNITQINSSVILLGVQIDNSPYLISGLSDGIYYFVVVAINEYGNFSSNCIFVEVKLFPPGVLMLSSDANNPDLDGVFNLTWTSSEYANNYSIYVSNRFITQINSSVVLLEDQIGISPYSISGLLDGTYYYVVVAFNEYGNTSSNCIQVIVSGSLEEVIIPGYNLFIFTGIISIFIVIIIRLSPPLKNCSAGT